jgi:putative ABC transport system ATP-binding protein
MADIIAENLGCYYGRGEARVMAVHQVDFGIAWGEFVALMGESGAGKSTLLTMMGAMNSPSAGHYRVDGIDVYGLNAEQRADFRREYLGFVFQRFHLMPYLSVLENVMLPLAVAPLTRKQKRQRAMDALAWVGLDTKAKRLPGEISGGEMERVAVGRAIVNDPPILLADEPTGNLDSRTSHEIMALLQRLNQEGMTIIMVTHSQACADYAARVMEISDGRLTNDRQVGQRMRLAATG